MKKHYIAMALTASLVLGSSCASHKYEVESVDRVRLLVDSRFDAQPDKEALAFLAPYEKKVDSIMSPVVGNTAHYMARHHPESELSNLLADILVWAAADYNEKPDFAVYNMGGIRAALPQGKITAGDINDMAPFENKICFLTLSGETTRKLFEQLAHRGGEAVSHSVRMVITHDGKLVSVTVNGEPIEANKTYRVATLDYLAEGNDQLTAFKQGTNVNAPKKKENNVRYVIMNYFRKQMEKGQAVSSKVEGRVTVADNK